MKVTVNTIVTLENQEQFIVLSEAIYQDKKYFLVMGFNEQYEVDSKKVYIFEEEVEGLDTYFIKVEDSELLAILMNILKKQL